MKRFLPLLLASLAAVLLSTSCVYDPLYSGSYASGSYGSGYGYDGGYSGGYYGGVYSDHYVGYSNDFYRYRHTRCSHCNHYPCRGGHSTNYYTYYQNYRSPLHGHGHRGHHSYVSDHDDHHPRGHYRSHPSSASDNHGDRDGHFGRFDDHRTDRPSSYGTGRNNSNYEAPRGSGNRPDKSLPHPASVVSHSPGPTPHSQPAPTVQVKTEPAIMPTRNVGRNYGSSSSHSSSDSPSDSPSPSPSSPAPTRNVGRKYQ